MIKLHFKLLVFSIFFLALFFSCSKEDPETEFFTHTEDLSRPHSQGGEKDDRRGHPSTSGRVVDFSHNVVRDWMDLFLDLDRYITGMRPNATARAIAYINLAAYETALAGMPDFVSNDHILNGLRIKHNDAPQQIQWELALNACYSVAFDHFLINLPSEHRQYIEQLEILNESKYGKNLPQKTVDDSKSWGTKVAERIIAYSKTDDQAEQQILDPQPVSYVPPTGDGYWTFSAEPERALFPYWGKVRSFLISPDETSTVAPIDYSETPGSQYFKQMMQVYQVNNRAKAEENEDLWIAEFWSDDVEGLVFSPPARQISIANQLIEQFDLNLEQTLHLFVKLGMSLNDAAVSTWKYKYEYMVMRPSVYIQEFVDSDFQTNLFKLIPWPNPTFPGYPSGHSCFASAAGGIFIQFFGNDIEFTDRSHEGRTEFRGDPRTFFSIEALAKENAYSRIPLGVHIRMDCDEGIRLGYEIAKAVNNYSLRRSNS